MPASSSRSMKSTCELSISTTSTSTIVHNSQRRHVHYCRLAINLAHYLQSISQVHWILQICRYRSQSRNIKPKSAKCRAWEAGEDACTMLDEEPDKLLAARMGCAAAGARIGGGPAAGEMEARFVKDVRRCRSLSTEQTLLLTAQRLKDVPHSWCLQCVQVASPCDFLRCTRAG